MLDSVDHRKLLAEDPDTVARFVNGLEHLALRIARHHYRFRTDEAEDILLDVVRKLWDADRALEDGLLQGFEVRRLPLQAELVSLAACDSGLGQLSRAEGIVGMARAFLVAGSRNVLVSLWAVDDRASGSLIDRFYGELHRKSSLPRALQRAKLGLLDEIATDTVVTGEERIAYAHPYFWSTYVLIGGDR